MDSVGRTHRRAVPRGVVDLMVRRGGQMQVTGLNTLRAYWEALRPAGGVPRRAEIDPRGIESALDIAFLAERVAPRVARFRLAGRQLNALMGMELRGMPLTALIEPDARDAFADALERVFAGPAMVEIALRGASGLTRPRLDARMLLLPLRAEDGRISRALGGLATEGRIGLTPRRLDLTAVQVLPLPGAPATERAAPAPSPDGPAPVPGAAAVPPGFAEPPAAFAGPARGRPALRLIRNDD